jgi:hypothetical protein
MREAFPSSATTWVIVYPLVPASTFEDEFNFEEAVSHIEAYQASRLPASRELL